MLALPWHQPALGGDLRVEEQERDHTCLLTHCPSPCPMQGDSHKLDFRNDLLPCLPGPYGALPPGQELSHSAASLFTATGESGQPSLGLRVPTCSPRPTLHTLSLICLSVPGAVHAAANPFTAAPGAHGPFLSPSTHIGKSQGHVGQPRP